MTPEIERVRTSVEAILANAPLTLFAACMIVALLWFAWYVVRGRP